MQRYISRELTHFVGRSLCRPDEQYRLLVKILLSGWLTYPPHDPNSRRLLSVTDGVPLSSNEKFQIGYTCFCDIPVGDLHLHMHKYSRFGLSFLKPFLVAKGANPVFYIAENSVVLSLGYGDTRRKWFDDIRSCYEAAKGELMVKFPDAWKELSNLFFYLHFMMDGEIGSFMKFFDDAKSDDDPENYYMEREWRLTAPVNFTLDDVCRVILPSSYKDCFRHDCPGYTGQITFAD